MAKNWPMPNAKGSKTPPPPKPKMIKKAGRGA